MIQDELFICGPALLSHPVSFLFHVDEGVAKGEPQAELLNQKKLAIVDCRVARAKDVATWANSLLSMKKPVLLLCPDTDALESLRNHVGVLPLEPVAALFIRSSTNPSGIADFRVHALAYTRSKSGTGFAEGPGPLAKQPQAPIPSQSAVECASTDFAALAGAFVDPAAVDTFKIQVEEEMDPRASVKILSEGPPTGLKYFCTVLTFTYPFTYSKDGTSNNSAGVATFTWTVWGFLGQTAQSNSQYLVVEGRISVNAGSLHANNQSDRGFGNAYVQGTLAAAPMSPHSFVPTSGQGTFSGAVSIPISYKDPLGGYQIWNYSSSVNNSVDSWNCKSISFGANLGAQWWMTRPCDGSNIPDTYKDAFTFWGHVKDLTGASSGSLYVNSISAWYTNQLLKGYQTVTGDFGWEGFRFWPSWVPFWYRADWITFPNSNPGFAVDFTPINPS